MEHAIEVVRTKNTVEIIKETGFVLQKETGHTTQIVSPQSAVVELVERGGKGAKGDKGDDGASADLSTITTAVNDVVGDDETNFQLWFENQLSQGA